MSTRGGVAPTLTAHERFKARSRLRFWTGLALAVLLHAALLWWGPSLRYETSPDSARGEATQALRLVPLGEQQRVTVLPPAPPLGVAEGARAERPTRSEASRRAPELAGRPAVPRVTTESLGAETEALIESAGRGRYSPPAVEVPPLPTPAPAPPAPKTGLDSYRHVNALMQKPELLNRAQVRRALLRNYPRELQRAGVEGAVIIWFWIDEKGKVQKYEIRASSGNPALDAAAERVIPMMRFRPAKERGEAVPVIATLPIRFEVE